MYSLTEMTNYLDPLKMALLLSTPALMALASVNDNVDAQDDEIFRVQIGLFGVNNTDNKDDLATAFVTVNDITKSRLINTTELDSEDSNGLDGIIELVPFSFPNTTVNVGEEFTACAFIFQTLNAFCETEYNSPINKVEYVGISMEDEEDSNEE